jgi:hypothetical protein
MLTRLNSHAKDVLSTGCRDADPRIHKEAYQGSISIEWTQRGLPPLIC